VAGPRWWRRTIVWWRLYVWTLIGSGVGFLMAFAAALRGWLPIGIAGGLAAALLLLMLTLALLMGFVRAALAAGTIARNGPDAWNWATGRSEVVSAQPAPAGRGSRAALATALAVGTLVLLAAELLHRSR